MTERKKRTQKKAPAEKALPPGTKEGLLTAYASPALQRRSLRSAEKLLNAAELVLGRDGWQNFTINAVAEEAGTSVGGIYRRFENKEQLLRAIKDRVLERADKRHKEVLDTCKARTLEGAVQHYVAHRIEGLKDYGWLLRQIFEGQRRDLVMEERGRASVNVGLRVFRSIMAPHRAAIHHPDPELAIETAYFMMTAIFMRRVRGSISDLSLDHLDWDTLHPEVRDAVILYLRERRPVTRSTTKKSSKSAR